MKRFDRKELNDATVLTYALVMALIDELSPEAMVRVVSRASAHVPPLPKANDLLPSDKEMHSTVHATLEKLLKQAMPKS